MTISKDSAECRAWLTRAGWVPVPCEQCDRWDGRTAMNSTGKLAVFAGGPAREFRQMVGSGIFGSVRVIENGHHRCER